MVKVSKKSSSSAAKVVAGVPMPPVRSSAAEKGTKLRRRSHEKKKKKFVKLEKQIVKLRKELDSQDAKRDALEARAREAENKLQDYILKLENVVAGVPAPPVTSSAAEKGTKLRRRSAEKNKKKKAEKSALTAKKSKDSKPKQKCEDIYVGPKDTEVEDYDPSVHGIHYFQCFQEERSLPQDSKILYATDIDLPEGRELSQDDFVKFFSDVGKVVKVEIHFDPKYGDVVDFAKIEFESHDVAKKAMEEKDSRLFYNCGAISLDGLPKAKNPGYKREDFTDKLQVIYVTGFGKKPILGHKLRSKLTDYFSVCGVVNWITTPTDDYGYSTGHAFIEFKNEESLNNALRLEGTLFLGYPLKVGRSKVFVTSI